MQRPLAALGRTRRGDRIRIAQQLLPFGGGVGGGVVGEELVHVAVRQAGDRIRGADAARVETDDVVVLAHALAQDVVGILRVLDPGPARATRVEQQGAHLGGGLGGRDLEQGEREGLTIGRRVVDRDLDRGALLLGIARAGRPDDRLGVVGGQGPGVGAGVGGRRPARSRLRGGGRGAGRGCGRSRRGVRGQRHGTRVGVPAPGQDRDRGDQRQHDQGRDEHPRGGPWAHDRRRRSRGRLSHPGCRRPDDAVDGGIRLLAGLRQVVGGRLVAQHFKPSFGTCPDT